MTPRAYDKFMVAVDIGTNRKLRRLPAAQRWAFVAGVLSLAAQSPMRGALLITDGERVTPEDVRDEATVTLKDARATLESLRRLGMLDKDEHGVEWVHDWEDFNPDPRPSDSPEARRERKRLQRQREREEKSPGSTTVTPMSRVTSPPGHDVSRGEVEVEEEVSPPPNPLLTEGEPFPEPVLGKRQRDTERYKQDVAAWMAAHFQGALLGSEKIICELAARLRRAGIQPTPGALREMADHNGYDFTENAYNRVRQNGSQVAA